MARQAVLLLLVLAACGPQPTAEEKARQADRDVAMVEQTNAAPPPLEHINAETIVDRDIDANTPTGPACTYSPGPNMGARVIARKEDGFMKLNGKVVRFAADSGSAELPLATRAAYLSKAFVLELTIKDEGKSSGGEAPNYEGTVTLRDSWNRVVYTASGSAKCAI